MIVPIKLFANALHPERAGGPKTNERQYIPPDVINFFIPLYCISSIRSLHVSQIRWINFYLDLANKISCLLEYFCHN